MMKEKKGQQREYLIALILGLIALTLIMFFIFQELFTEEDINYETCRQSIILRANSPELKAGELSLDQLRKTYPLKCKTQTINIDFKNKKQAEELIAKELATCWALMEEGEEKLFDPGTLSVDSFCHPCTRIRFDKEVQEYYQENTLDIQEGLKQKLPRSTIPRYIDSTKGDIMIFFQQIVTSNGEAEGNAKKGVIGPDGKPIKSNFLSNLIYFQTEQKNPEPFKEFKKNIMEGKGYGIKMCDHLVGIPA
jgi:hypothetical protein